MRGGSVTGYSYLTRSPPEPQPVNPKQAPASHVTGDNHGSNGISVISAAAVQASSCTANGPSCISTRVLQSEDPVAPVLAASADGDPRCRFLKGVGLSVWQCSGDSGSNWTRFTRGRWPLRHLGVPAVRGGVGVEVTNGFWDRYAEDIRLATELGCTSFRFSIEWARIEPERGIIDMEAVRRYHQMLDCMAAHSLEPNATLWHFVHPTWFEDAGGFMREENIAAFVEYCKRCFGWFGSRIRLWATFNEPTSYLFLGWVIGIAPPGHIMDLAGGGRMLGNLLKAHVAAYKAIKAMPGGLEARVGLVNHHITFEPQSTGLLYALAKVVADWMTYWVGSNVMERWMLTGEFVWRLPVLGVWQRWRDPAGKPPCDWWGINYYSRGVVSWCLTPAHRQQEVMTDMYYPIYPEGMYRAIKRCSEFGIPMYITETGIADARDDRRAAMIEAYLQQVFHAVADGYDVRGVYYWTLVDALEWATGYTMKFGLYAWEPDGSVDRKLKEGSVALKQIYQRLPDDMNQLRRAAREQLEEQQHRHQQKQDEQQRRHQQAKQQRVGDDVRRQQPHHRQQGSGSGAGLRQGRS